MSRPKTKPELKRQNLNVTLSPNLIGKAKAYACMSGYSVSSMVEASLGDFLLKLERELKKNHLP